MEGATPRTLRLPDGVWLVEPGSRRQLQEVRLPVVTEELQLPLSFLVREDRGLQAERPVGYFRQLESDSRRADGLFEWTWHPFVDSPQAHLTKWSYGHCQLRLLVAGETRFEIDVEVVPSTISKEHIESMRRAVSAIADELLRCSRGVIHSPVGTLSMAPREAAEVLDQLQRKVPPVLPSVRAVAHRPFLPHLDRRPERRPWGASRQRESSLDTPENRFVVNALRRWRGMLNDCSARIDDTLTNTSAELERWRAGSSEDASPNFVKAREDEIAQLERQRETCATLRAQLTQAGAPLGALPLLVRPLALTPRVQRSPHLLRVFSAWHAIRREVSIAVPDREATRPDIPASLLYERWALLALLHLTLKLGFVPDFQEAWCPIDVGRFEMRLRTNHPWRFRRADGVTLELAYEPTLMQRSARGRGTPRGKAITSIVESDQPVKPGAFCVTRAVTPDYLLYLQRPDGAACLVVGDALYNPWPVDVAGSHPDPPHGQRHSERLSALKSKIAKVRNYAKSTWVVREGGEVVPAKDHLGFVVFPGPPGMQVLPDDSEDAVDYSLLPMTPATWDEGLEQPWVHGDSIHDWRQFLERALDEAETPTERAKNVLGEYRLR